MKSVSTLIEFSVTPLGLSAESVAPQVAACVKLIRDSKLPHELHSMGTIVEGDLDECLKLVGDCVRETLKSSPRVSVAVKMDVRPGRSGRIKSKVQSVEKLLSQK